MLISLFNEAAAEQGPQAGTRRPPGVRSTDFAAVAAKCEHRVLRQLERSHHFCRRAFALAKNAAIADCRSAIRVDPGYAAAYATLKKLIAKKRSFAIKKSP